MGEKASPDDPSGNFHVVSPTLYRGGRPDQAGVSKLAAMGVRTIVDLEDDGDAVATERGWAASLGLEHRNAPMNGQKTPNDAMVDELLALFVDEQAGPVFVHCQEGVDRTGVIVGLYRVFDEGWAAADAYDEMKALGFKTHLSALRDYYSVKTGYTAQP
jgi:tyrosine-protein phosphatase SIW14